MKRLTLILFAALCIAANLSAQNKPGKGSFGTEVQFNPFDQNGETFKLDGLKFRYFVTDKDAIRLKLGFNLDHSNFTNKEEGETQADYTSTEFKYNVGDFRLDAGYERHFDISKRVNVYVGGSFGFTRHFASTKLETVSNELSTTFKGEITNGAITPDSKADELDIENMLPAVNDRAYWGINAAIFTGLDFYVYKGLYVGTELGLKLENRKSSKMTYRAVADKTNYLEETTDKAITTKVKTYIEPVLRLGWTF